MIQNVVLGKNPLNPDSPDMDGLGTPGNGMMSGDSQVMELFANGVLNALLSGKGTIQDVLKGGFPVILMAVREVTSVEAILMVIGACVVLIGLLFLINMKQLRVAVRCVGITAMLAGLPFAAATVLAFAMPSMFTGTALSIVYLGVTLTAGVAFGVFGGGLVLLIVSIVIGFVIPINIPGLKGVAYTFVRAAIKLLLIPVIMGVGYELLKFAGRHENLLTRIISAPGMWLQRITVREPTDDMIECAIKAFVAVMPEEDREAMEAELAATEDRE
jgi:hypothetical protein